MPKTNFTFHNIQREETLTKSAVPVRRLHQLSSKLNLINHPKISPSDYSSPELPAEDWIVKAHHLESLWVDAEESRRELPAVSRSTST